MQNKKSGLPSYSAHSESWSLDKEIVFLNHGSFGATPTAILKKQQELRDRLESEPVRFLVRELYPLYETSLNKLAGFINADSSGLVFVKNATMGVNTVFHSLQLKEGDEVLVHSHAYGACINTIKWYAERFKFTINIANVPYPVKDASEITEAFLKAVTPKTKIALLDHITSPTGIIFPVKEITKALQEKNVEVLIDGAHAPGHIELDVDDIGAEYYTGNCHKWICSPKGSAFLHVRKDKQKTISPLQISHHFDAPVEESKKWRGQFFWPGTDDYTAYCCVGGAIEFFEKSIDGGWKEIRKKNHQLAVQARKHISEQLGTALPCPDDMIGNLATIYIDETPLPPYGFNYINPLQEILFSKYKIEVPVFTFNREQPRKWVRISAQLYNSMEQYEYLSDCLLAARGK